jgi:hypothetical protein
MQLHELHKLLITEAPTKRRFVVSEGRHAWSWLSVTLPFYGLFFRAAGLRAGLMSRHGARSLKLRVYRSSRLLVISGADGS